MQTLKRQRKSAPRRPSVRYLKIQPKFRANRWSQSITPEIKLCGNWLQELGFQYGEKVTVTTMNELLIIRIDKLEMKEE